MADPIPRNSRADESAEFRRAELERRGNRPLFGQGMAGGLRARIDEAEQRGQARAQPQAQPQAQPRPNPAGNPAQGHHAQRPPHAQPQVQARPNPAPQAEPRNFGAALRRAVANQPQAGQLRQLSERINAYIEREPRRAGLGTLLAVFIAAFSLNLLTSGANNGSGSLPAPADPIPVEMAMIPAPPPREECSAVLKNVDLYADAKITGVPHAMVAEMEIEANGCENQWIRSAIWVYVSEGQPLLAPAASMVYREQTGQLTAQTLTRIQPGGEMLTLSLGIPHDQFPTALNTPVWLTFGVQVWPEGEAAQAGSMILDQVYFIRKQ